MALELCGAMQVTSEQLDRLFNALTDVVFFIKDANGRYTHANQTLVRRLRLAHRSDVLGRYVAELFPSGMAASYAAQDQHVLAGDRIERHLEVHVFDNLVLGWCLTSKQPLIVDGQICGLIGLSQDLGSPDGKHHSYDRLQRVIAHMQAHFADPIRIGNMAELACCSVAQLERHFRRVFQLTPHQALTKIRIEAAMHPLSGTTPISAISMACGFSDQSALARQFKAIVGLARRPFMTVSPSVASSLDRSVPVGIPYITIEVVDSCFFSRRSNPSRAREHSCAQSRGLQLRAPASTLMA